MGKEYNSIDKAVADMAQVDWVTPMYGALRGVFGGGTHMVISADDYHDIRANYNVEMTAVQLFRDEGGNSLAVFFTNNEDAQIIKDVCEYNATNARIKGFGMLIFALLFFGVVFIIMAGAGLITMTCNGQPCNLF